MLENLESIIEDKIDDIGWIPKLVIGPEVKEMKQVLANSREMRSNYQPTLEWHTNYAETVNRGFETAYSAVAETYDVYESVKSIPLLGGFLSGFVESKLTKMLKVKRLPQKAEALSLVSDVHYATLASYAQYTEAEIGVNAEAFLGQVKRPLQEQHYDSLFRGAVHNISAKINSFFGYEGPRVAQRAPD